ncbi:MAG: hypothetical protein JXB49_26425 [Bacteroidales bacterium]|nr:hypothetical protein [Bacteroidales bacterium]
MKLGLLISVFSISTFCSKKEVSYEKLTTADRDDINKVFDMDRDSYNTPYSGKAFLHYNNGQKMIEANFSKGYLHGSFTTWYENGDKQSECEYRHGKLLPTWKFWTLGGEALDVGTLKDIDDNIYKTIKIGDQWWMAENLKVTRYRNGDPITHAVDASTWDSVEYGAYCKYEEDRVFFGIAPWYTYGYLYNWYSVQDSRNISPEGWHVPTDDDWMVLEMSLGMSRENANSNSYRGQIAGKMMEICTNLWSEPNAGVTNRSGFSILPGGHRSSGSSHYFHGDGGYAYFWTRTEKNSDLAISRSFQNNELRIGKITLNKKDGCSIRCVKN